MLDERLRSTLPQVNIGRGEVMVEPDDVSAILGLKELGWGTRRIAGEVGVSRNTVKHYLEAGGWTAYKQPRRKKALDGLEDWLRERFKRHRGNADVVRQELAAEKGITVSLRTVQRAVAGFRRELAAEARATVRFETPPGRQMQIDFGERRVAIGGVLERVYLFVATLGYSRRLHVRAFRHERQESWFAGLESAFHAFGGVSEEVLLDNARALVERHDARTREVVFNPKLAAFAKHWRFTPRACAPYRARSKGKTESGVGYVKHNAIAGRRFESFEALEAHLAAWTREVADRRIHGTTGEAPLARFKRAEETRLQPIEGVPPFQTMRALVRKVQADCMIEVDGNGYSVPWRLIGERVAVTVTAGQVRISHGGKQVARHELLGGRRQRVRDPAHFEGVAGFKGRAVRALGRQAPAPRAEAGESSAPALLRPLSEYEAYAGGGW